MTLVRDLASPASCPPLSRSLANHHAATGAGSPCGSQHPRAPLSVSSWSGLAQYSQALRSQAAAASEPMRAKKRKKKKEKKNRPAHMGPRARGHATPSAAEAEDRNFSVLERAARCSLTTAGSAPATVNEGRQQPQAPTCPKFHHSERLPVSKGSQPHQRTCDAGRNRATINSRASSGSAKRPSRVSSAFPSSFSLSHVCRCPLPLRLVRVEALLALAPADRLSGLAFVFRFDASTGANVHFRRSAIKTRPMTIVMSCLWRMEQTELAVSLACWQLYARCCSTRIARLRSMHGSGIARTSAAGLQDLFPR